MMIIYLVQPEQDLFEQIELGLIPADNEPSKDK